VKVLGICKVRLQLRWYHHEQIIQLLVASSKPLVKFGCEIHIVNLKSFSLSIKLLLADVQHGLIWTSCMPGCRSDGRTPLL
jgi:hypothetical protein